MFKKLKQQLCIHNYVLDNTKLYKHNSAEVILIIHEFKCQQCDAIMRNVVEYHQYMKEDKYVMLETHNFICDWKLEDIIRNYTELRGFNYEIEFKANTRKTEYEGT